MTVLCVNCGEPAAWYHADPGVNPVDYCDRCLPVHERPRVVAGHFQDAQKVDPAVRTAAAAQFGDLQAQAATQFGAGPTPPPPRPRKPVR